MYTKETVLNGNALTCVIRADCQATNTIEAIELYVD